MIIKIDLQHEALYKERMSIVDYYSRFLSFEDQLPHQTPVKQLQLELRGVEHHVPLWNVFHKRTIGLNNYYTNIEMMRSFKVA